MAEGSAAARVTPQLTAGYKKALAMFGGREGISGVDVGRRYDADGDWMGDLAVRIHHSGDTPHPGFKLCEAFVRAADGVPLVVISAAYSIHTAAVDVAQERVALPPRRSRVDPLRPGVSISHWRTSGGTLGLVVYDIFSGRPCLLGNQHVLVPPRSGAVDDSVVQPAASDGGITPIHTIGRVVRSMLDVDGDAAVAQLGGARAVDRAQWESDVVIRRFRDARLGDVVEKSGVGTGVTRGVVDGIGRYYVSPTNPGGMDGFRIVSEDDAPDEELVGYGDSGAVWYCIGDDAGAGLHVGGDVTAVGSVRRAGIACHLGRVMRRLGVDVEPLPGTIDTERRLGAAQRVTVSRLA